ncbi:MAG: hypothetical protein GY874_04555 [Desulfobacteraceae bacterium]|nr:hypothetical protein [Desulfobacteraceae bacterium]
MAFHIIQGIEIFILFIIGLSLIGALNPPSILTAMIAAIIGFFVCYRCKRIKTKKGLFVVGALLIIWIVAFEYVRPGDIYPSTIINQIRFDQIAGSYYHGNGIGINKRLIITSEGRFFYKYSGSLGVYDRNKGWVSKQDGCLVLHPNFWSRKSFPTKLLPVKWGQRLYLVSDKRLKDFCNDIKKDQEPRKKIQGRYYLRTNKDSYADYEHIPSGSPQLPEKWLKYLFDNSLKNQFYP